MAKKSFASRASELAPTEQTGIETPTNIEEPEEAEETHRTTVMLTMEALDLLDAIKKYERRKNKKRTTYGAIIDEAIKTLAKHKGIE